MGAKVRAVVDKEAVPSLAVVVPSTVPPSRKVTMLPLGTVAVKVTSAPEVTVLFDAEDVSVRVCLLLQTVRLRTAKPHADRVSPL